MSTINVTCKCFVVVASYYHLARVCPQTYKAKHPSRNNNKRSCVVRHCSGCGLLYSLTIQMAADGGYRSCSQLCFGIWVKICICIADDMQCFDYIFHRRWTQREIQSGILYVLGIFSLNKPIHSLHWYSIIQMFTIRFNNLNWTRSQTSIPTKIIQQQSNTKLNIEHCASCLHIPTYSCCGMTWGLFVFGLFGVWFLIPKTITDDDAPCIDPML